MYDKVLVLYEGMVRYWYCANSYERRERERGGEAGFPFVRILVLFYTVNFTTYSSKVDYTILTLVPR
jgi:hypothetical protein